MLLIFIEVTAPMIATVPLKVVTAISLALILLSSPIPYTEKQTSVHDNDIVTIVATDLAGNKAEQLITISVKETNSAFVPFML
jgi:hypothetical protein